MKEFERIQARSILTPVSGFLAEAGFTHSLSPARNCTFGCLYCYVPTMRVQAGLRPEDWRHWGESTTFKQNAADLLRRELRPHQVIYCSPLTDPYQPAEAEGQIMPGILQAVIDRPPACFVIQTRGPLILRDLDLLRSIPPLRVSFSITTDREDVRRAFEPHCASIEDRWDTVQKLREAGIEVSVTLAPLLPCDPESLLRRALASTDGPVIADPLHVRAVKPRGATTREPALTLCIRRGWEQWLEPVFQAEVIGRMQSIALDAGRAFGHGPAGFGLLAKVSGNMRRDSGVL
jgi:DNA repair photolyase